jgi:uncharacterized membrane protein
VRYRTRLGSWWVRVPADLAAAVGYAVLVAAVFYLPVTDAAVRTLVGAPLLFFLPGYVAVAAAFPGRQPATADAATGALARMTSSASTRGFTWFERAALSFGVSVALLPLLALAESLALGSLAAPATVATLAAFVTAGAVVAGVRRLRLPADERYRGPVAAWAADLHAAIFDADSTVDALLTAALAVTVLLAVSTMAYAMAAPQDGERFSTLGVYTENETGDLVADGYPSNLSVGEPAELVAAVENHERRDVEYTLVVELQRVRTDGETASVVEDEVLDRESRAVAAGETWTWRHELAPTFAGEQLRVTYYLYRGDAPDDPSAETAYRRAFVWVNVTAA